MNEHDEIENESPYFAPMQLRIERRNICDSCEFKSRVMGVCKKCGCVIKSKTTLKASHCPIGKW